MKTDSELKEQALKALCLTRDYVGPETLPAIEGWEWYDSGLALAESMPESEWSRQFFLRVNGKNNKKLNTGAGYTEHQEQRDTMEGLIHQPFEG